MVAEEEGRQISIRTKARAAGCEGLEERSLAALRPSQE